MKQEIEVVNYNPSNIYIIYFYPTRFLIWKIPKYCSV